MPNETATLGPQILNPLTPLGFLHPDVAFRIMISTYVLVASCGVYIWDIVNNLKADYTLLFKLPIKLPTFVYITSRLATLGYVVAATIYQTAPVGTCAHFEMILNIFNTIAVPITSVICFLRVRAIYERNVYAVTFFAVMWLAVLASCFLTTQAVTGTAIGLTNYCMTSHISPYIVAAGVVPLAYDTIVFLAISWRLTRNSLYDLNFKCGVRVMILGDYMPIFSRSLLQDGQIYYLSTVSWGLLTVIMLSANTIPITYRTLFVVPNCIFTNIMACLVYRRTKFFIFSGNGISNVDVPTLPISFAAAQSRRLSEGDCST